MKEYIRFGLVLFVIATISATLLSSVNKITMPIIAERDLIAQIEARKSVYKNAEKFDETKKNQEDKYIFIPAFSGEKQLGYVVNAKAQGYGGDIDFTFAFDLDGKIEGVKILSAKETPGLGDKIFTDEWLKKWVGRDKNYEFQVGIDSFAGATISPKGVYTEMLKILKLYDEKVKK